ncbi:unnamed protein product [Ectocarpus sp. CCAP 1310/34]|nr:unnamed protein product [Ectocarpus sp. CCAP 1310/34]
MPRTCFLQPCAQRRKFDEAESVLRQALSESPSNPPALVLLGRVRATTGKLDEAEKLYRVALEASPRNAPAHHALAKVFAFQQRWAEAKESFERSLEADADNAEAWLGLGRVCMATGNEEAAERHYARSLSLDPSNALLHFDMGVLSCKRGQVVAADEAFARAGELNPKLDLTVVAQDPNNAVHQLAYGELCEALKDEEGAGNAYDEALGIDPGMGKAHFRKALLLTGTGVTNQAALYAFGLNAEEAKRHLREAVASGEEGTAIPATEALKWCEMEEREVEEWANALRKDQQKTKEGLPGERRDRQGEGGIGTASDKAGRRDEPAGAGVKREGAPSAWVEEAGGYLSLPEVEISGPEEFMEAFVNKSKPAVIKDGFAPKEAWSWTALSERFGDSVVRVSLSETGRFDGPEPGDMWGLAPDDEVLVRPPATSMAFSDFVRLLRQEDIKETFYLEYLALHQYLGTPMAVGTAVDAALSGLELLLTNIWVGKGAYLLVSNLGIVTVTYLIMNLWLGKGGTTAVLHYDDYENLLCQVRGTKELVLFPPKDLENLYYVGRRKGKLKYHFPGKWTRDELDGPNKVIFSSSVRLDDPDFERHPRCASGWVQPCASGWEGDVLYMPAFWHHEVRSYPDAEEGNVAVNFWFRNVTSFADEEREVLGIGGEPSRTEP